MKIFLLRIACFVSLLLTFYAVVWTYYSVQMRSFSFAIPSEKHILVIGDSQTQAAIDDDMLPMMKNISQSHDNYFTMLKRLQLYVEANSQIDTVIISLTPHTVAYWKDSFFIHYGYVDYAVKYYLPFFSVSEWVELLRRDPSDVCSSFFTPLRFYLSVDSSYLADMGCFKVAHYSHLQQDVAEGATRLKENGNMDCGNELTLASLRGIANYCQSKNIKLIGLNTPVYHAIEYLDVDYFNNIISTQFADIELWDYLDAEIPDSLRRDVNHLNRAGANWMAEVLGKRMSLNSKN